MNNMQNLYLLVPLAPLLGAIVAGLFGKVLGRTWTHRITILMVAVSFAASVRDLPGCDGRAYLQWRGVSMDDRRRHQH